MPVGTGSINRAARTSKKAAEVKKEEVKKEEVKVEKSSELRVYGNETVFVAGNECCHLTEELPIYLL